MLFNASDSGPRNVSSLPASGAALTANTIYNASSPVGTYVFTPSRIRLGAWHIYYG